MKNSAEGWVVSLGDSIDPEPNFENFVFLLFFNEILDPNSWNPIQSSQQN